MLPISYLVGLSSFSSFAIHRHRRRRRRATAPRRAPHVPPPRAEVVVRDPNGKIVGHSDISMIGGDAQNLFGADTFDATAEGGWMESESLRVWVAGYDGYVFGSGWSRDE